MVISVEEIGQQFASFNDPARLINHITGVSTASDQANHAIIRGAFAQWPGIWNPQVIGNHLTNAGTPSDETPH